MSTVTASRPVTQMGGEVPKLATDGELQEPPPPKKKN